MTAEILTLGCRLNIAESKAIADGLADAGDREIIVVNSCAVTNAAVRQTRQTIRRARRRRPDAHIVVTGCAAQIDPDMFSEMAEVDAVRGNREKRFASLFLPESSERKLVSDIMAVRETAPQLASAFADRVRAFIEVQNGCDHRCTFCIIPFGRGNSRSAPAGEVVETVARLVDEGVNEIVLTGVDLTSYGHDLPGGQTLGSLVERVLAGVPTLPRLRLSSLDGVEIDERLFVLLAGEARVMPHVHLSLQSGDDMILKRMKRRHSHADAIALVTRLRSARPEIAIGADIIAGFPTESEPMFARSLELVRECRIVHGHIFPYSERAGTSAARMPQVPVEQRKDRAARLRAAVTEQRGRWLNSLVGSRQSVLIENGECSGRAANFAPVRIDKPAAAGSIVDLRITAIDGDGLTGIAAT